MVVRFPSRSDLTSNTIRTTCASMAVSLVTNIFICLFVFVELSCGQRVLWLYQLPKWQVPYQNDRFRGGGHSDSFLQPVYISFAPQTGSVAAALAPFHSPKYGNWQKPREVEDNQIETEINVTPESGNSEETQSAESYQNTNGIRYQFDTMTTGEVVVVHRCDSIGLTRFHHGTNSCHAIGTQGPCGDYMVFTAKDRLNGQCECDQSSFERPLVQIGNQCHLLFTQAMCPQGYWLTLMTPSGDPGCMPNPCRTFANSVFFKNECVPLNGSSKHCKPPQVVIFPEGSPEPSCGYPKSKRRLHRRQISNVRRFSCPQGQRRRATGRCMSIKRTIVFTRV